MIRKYYDAQATGGGSPHGTEKGEVKSFADTPLPIVKSNPDYTQPTPKTLVEFVELCWPLIYGEFRNRQEKPSDPEWNDFTVDLYQISKQILDTPPQEATPSTVEKFPPFPDKLTFKEMLSNLFNVDFLNPEELDTISKAGEMYANGCLRQSRADQPNQGEQEERLKKYAQDTLETIKRGGYDQEVTHGDYDSILEEFILNPCPSILPIVKELISIEKDFWYA